MQFNISHEFFDRFRGFKAVDSFISEFSDKLKLDHIIRFEPIYENQNLNIILIILSQFISTKLSFYQFFEWQYKVFLNFYMKEQDELIIKNYKLLNNYELSKMMLKKEDLGLKTNINNVYKDDIFERIMFFKIDNLNHQENDIVYKCSILKVISFYVDCLMIFNELNSEKYSIKIKHLLTKYWLYDFSEIPLKSPNNVEIRKEEIIEWFDKIKKISIEKNDFNVFGSIDAFQIFFENVKEFNEENILSSSVYLQQYIRPLLLKYIDINKLLIIDSKKNIYYESELNLLFDEFPLFKYILEEVNA